jgi:hypothetical protein
VDADWFGPFKSISSSAAMVQLASHARATYIARNV